jgi:tetratricopeptide (TPR) repeat protein
MHETETMDLPDVRLRAGISALGRGAKELMDEARMAERDGDLSRAAGILDAFLEEAPHNFDVLCHRARVALAANKLPEAKCFALRARGISLRNPKPAVLLARIADKEGNRALALELWREVPPGHNAYGERLVASARLLLALERPEEALANLELAIVQRPTDIGVRRSLAMLLLELGQHERAETQLRAILKLRPDDKDVTRQLAAIPSIQRSPAAEMLLRFRDAMRAVSNPVILAVGGDFFGCLLASNLLPALAAHFNTKIDILAARPSPMIDLIFGSNPAVRQLLHAGEEIETYEVAFVLPGFVHDGADHARPKASLLFDFVTEVTVQKADTESMHQAYVTWVAGVLSLPPNLLAASRTRIEHGYTPPVDAPVLVVRRDFNGRKAAGDADLTRKISEAGIPATTIDLAAALDEQGADSVLQRLAQAPAIVCEDEASAVFVAMLNVRSVFLAATSRGRIVRQLAPDTIILQADCPRFPCGEQPQERWRAVTGSCACPRNIAGDAIIQAVSEILNATATHATLQQA